MNPPPDRTKDTAPTGADRLRKTAGFWASTIRGIGYSMFMPFAVQSRHSAKPGASPGIEHYLLQPDVPSNPVTLTVTDYGPNFCTVTCFEQVEAALAHPEPADPHVRWLNVDGLNPAIVERICRHYGIHTLSAEDTLNTLQRPKIEVFEDHLQIVARQIHISGEQLRNEQISCFLFKDTLISFQEEVGDVFGPVRKRLNKSSGRFRTYKADYLLYALLDSIVDHLFPLLESYGSALEALEIEIIDHPSPRNQQQLFSIKRDLSQQRRALWPIREVLDQLCRESLTLIDEDLHSYLRDVQDHTMQILDILESYRDTASGLNDLYQSMIGNKMNETMKLLTLMASFFIPITFLAGVYGMNFEHIPELSWRYAYPAFWAICILTSSSLALFFWKNGWIGQRK